ncbi:MAG: aminopeptidase P family protein [Ruminococcaceae bacterium]|nr:aminopeptidase P family protein [Oscillospiraceae bacterium]
MKQTTNEKIASLRHSMKTRGISAYVIPSADPHLSEYFSAHWAARAYFSGFTGSAGTLVVTDKMSGLWTDGRYYLQASMQLADSEITLFRAADPDCPKIFDYLSQSLPSGSTVALDGMLFSENALTEARSTLTKKDIRLCLDSSVVEENWPDRPAECFTEIFELDESHSGCSRPEKLIQLRSRLKEKGADATVIAGLDSIAWLLNLRASDISKSPVFISFLYISLDAACLFTELSRLPENIAEKLKTDGIELRPYTALSAYISEISILQKLLCDPDTLNAAIFSTIRSNSLLDIIPGNDPVIDMKAIKNPCELRCQQEAYLRDGCALAEFFAELFENLENGETPTEYELTKKLSAYRLAQPGCTGDSFGAIIAYRQNAAIVHYSPSQNNSAVIHPEHMLLVDSGGQYLNGTTDTTRTVALGPISDEEKRDFTLVLKGHIALAEAVFPEGTTGRNLDPICRVQLWKYGLNYRHGTGHGVGFMLNVHEGPHNFSGNVPLREGMVITIEPGFYHDGSHGIRTENVYYVTKAFSGEYGHFLRFENFTLFPIDTNCVDFALLSTDEKTWLQNYNRTVLEQLSPLVSHRAEQWLRRFVF